MTALHVLLGVLVVTGLLYVVAMCMGRCADKRHDRHIRKMNALVDAQRGYVCGGEVDDHEMFDHDTYQIGARCVARTQHAPRLCTSRTTSVRCTKTTGPS